MHKNFSQLALGNIALRVAEPSLNLANSIILVRLAGIHDYGIFILYMAILNVAMRPVNNSLSILIVRHFAAHHARSEWALISGLLKRVSMLGLTLCLALMGLFYSAGYLGRDFLPDNSISILLAMLFLLPLQLFNNLCSAILRGFHHVFFGQITDKIIIPAATLLLATSLYLYAAPFGASALVYLQAFATLFALVVGALMLKNSLPCEIKGVEASYRSKEWLRGIKPIFFTNMSRVINNEIIVIVLGNLYSVESVGVYRICERGSRLVTFVFNGLNDMIAPTFAKLYTLGRIAELKKFLSNTIRFGLLSALPVGLPLVLYSEYFLELMYGSALVIGAGAFSILCAAQLFNVSIGALGNLLAMTSHDNEIFMIALSITILNVALSIAFIPYWGLVGAAIISAALTVLRNIMTSWYVYHCLGIKPFSFMTS